MCPAALGGTRESSAQVGLMGLPARARALHALAGEPDERFPELRCHGGIAACDDAFRLALYGFLPSALDPCFHFSKRAVSR